MVSLDARSKNGMKSITDIIMEACKEKMERDRKRGIKNRPVRAMVVGIPNVGKSTFINSYAGKACATVSYTHLTQFIVITHRRGTMTAADRLYGITMQEKGVSTLVSVDLIEHDLN